MGYTLNIGRECGCVGQDWSRLRSWIIRKTTGRTVCCLRYVFRLRSAGQCSITGGIVIGLKAGGYLKKSQEDGPVAQTLTDSEKGKNHQAAKEVRLGSQQDSRSP